MDWGTAMMPREIIMFWILGWVVVFWIRLVVGMGVKYGWIWRDNCGGRNERVCKLKGGDIIKRVMRKCLMGILSTWGGQAGRREGSLHIWLTVLGKKEGEERIRDAMESRGKKCVRWIIGQIDAVVVGVVAVVVVGDGLSSDCYCSDCYCSDG